MSKLIRHAQKRGTALFLATGLIGLILLSLLTFIGGPQSHDGGTPAETQVSAPAQPQAALAQTQRARMLTATDKSALRRSAHFANKLYEPRASQVFNLATSRAAAAHNSELPNGATLTTDCEDYPPFSYVYFHGSEFEPGETVDMLLVETDPDPQSFEPWQVVADENGEFDTSWYVFSEEFIGATFQATATGQTSQLTASCTFTDGTIPYIIAPAFTTPSATVTFSTLVQDNLSVIGSIRYTVPPIPAGWTILSGSVTATSNNSTWAAGVVGGGGSHHHLPGERRERGSRKRLGAPVLHRHRAHYHRQSKLEGGHVEQQHGDWRFDRQQHQRRPASRGVPEPTVLREVRPGGRHSGRQLGYRCHQHQGDERHGLCREPERSHR